MSDALRALCVVAAALALGGGGCPPPAEDPLCTEMIKCMYGDEDRKAILESEATKEKYRGLLDGEAEIRAAYGPGGTCWRREGDDGKRLREVCHHECLCALGAACLDPAFRTELCKRDAREPSDCNEDANGFTGDKANYVAGADDEFTCKDKDDKNVVIGGGTCCHHPEIAPTLARDVADTDFLPGCGSIGARDRCERYPDNEKDFCNRDDEDKEQLVDGVVGEQRFAHCQCTFSEQFHESERVESCTLDELPPGEN